MLTYRHKNSICGLFCHTTPAINCTFNNISISSLQSLYMYMCIELKTCLSICLAASLRKPKHALIQDFKKILGANHLATLKFIVT